MQACTMLVMCESNAQQLMTYIDSLASIKWFVSAGRPDPDAAVASDLSDAWDGYREQWNARSMDIFDQQARRIELEAQAALAMN